MKIAILHEMLIKFGGAEKVVETFLDTFPEADLFTLIYDKKKIGKFFSKEKINKQCFNLKTQKTYNITKRQRFCLPYMAKSVEQLDFSKYDIVLCSSSGFAHGAITKPETKFIVYYHSPARYMWDWTNEYKKDLKIPNFIKPFFIYKLNKLFFELRQWDYIASKRHNITLANSNNTANRIKKYYKLDSKILFPPIETERFGTQIEINNTNYHKLAEKHNFSLQNYYIIISALTEFKKIDVAINAFNKLPNNKLVIIGDGDYKKELESLAKNNISFVGRQYLNDLVALVQNSLGLIFPGEEDFGMVPVEVMSAGLPVFALNKGGLTETVIAGKTGDFFNNPDGVDFINSFEIFHQNNLSGKYKPENCKKQANKFSKQNFIKQLKIIVKD